MMSVFYDLVELLGPKDGRSVTGTLPAHSTNTDKIATITTRYGLDGPGVESRLGRDFPHLSRPALRLTQPPTQWVPVLYRG